MSAKYVYCGGVQRIELMQILIDNESAGMPFHLLPKH